MLIPVVTRDRAFQRNFVQRLSQLGVTYKGSPVVEGAGERYFDPSPRGGNGIGSRFILFAAHADGQVTALKQLANDFADVLELRDQASAGIRLVRPDGYTGYVAGDIRKRSLEAARRVLQAQVA